jgi:hypothetical protein
VWWGWFFFCRCRHKVVWRPFVGEAAPSPTAAAAPGLGVAAWSVFILILYNLKLSYFFEHYD